ERAANGYNNRNLVFEQYVLSVYFDDILYAANQRLSVMSLDRYALCRLPQSKDRRTKEGMELEVLDQYTGKKRSVRSLSGGESFKAALALALGTSDIVQSYAGGIQIETLFVDEGFGSLDHESLNQAIEILKSLSDGSLMIGIISHVEELKEQIDHQIVIEKTNQGSKIKVMN
ncbi:MAG: SbcC/MukB-like Walker B domain-containing protein, partial [Hungatella sp.]